MEKIKVLLAEDHTIVRKGLESLLELEPGIEVVGEAEDGREAVQKVEQLCPHVVVMDISMPGLNGIEGTSRIRKAFPKIKVLILSMHGSEEYVFQSFRAGASGYVIKKAAPAEVVAAIKTVYRGESFISPSISGKILQDYIRTAEMISDQDETFNRLTTREREVFQLVTEGLSNREIADLLYLSIKTVQTHRARIMKKLGINSTAELTKYAVRKGLVDPDF